jgi:alpha-L-fucosidase
VYDIQYKTFNPTKYNPDEIVELAKRAGVKYVVFTAKHHAGFSMFDSKVSEYDIMSAPYGKDILKELEQACRKHDVDLGFYYSPRDWYHPDCDSEHHHDRYIEFYKAQMEELLNNYGPIYEIWFDGLGPGDWGDTSTEVMKRIRELHPDAMVNDRGGVGADFYTPEHTVSAYNDEQLWEACHTTTTQWGYNPKVKAKPLSQLMEILLYTWGGDGNMLLNIGPMGDGSMNPLEQERLEQLADWWAMNGEESIRSSRGGPYLPGPWGVSTRKGNKVYLHVFHWDKDGGLNIPKFKGLDIESVRMLNKGKVTFSDKKDCFRINVEQAEREEIVTTVEVTFSQDVMTLKPENILHSLTSKATLVASSNSDELGKVIDNDATTSWHAKPLKGEKSIWIEATFEEPVTIGSIVTARGEEWYPRNRPELQIPDGKGGWKTVFKWKPKWEPVKFLKEPVETSKVRLLIKDAPVYYLAELELYAPF